jgi:hypothetical protein
MALHAENMNEVQSNTEMVPVDVWYHVRISKAEEGVSNTSGEPTVKLNLKIQDEPHIGRIIPDTASLQKHALFKLKAYYVATEYTPGSEGHDPEQLLDRECFVKPSSRMVEGTPMYDIKPHHIKSLRDGRPQR